MPLLPEVHAVTRAKINPHLKHPLAHGLAVTHVPEADPVESRPDARPGLDFLQGQQPLAKRVAPRFRHIFQQFDFFH